MQTNLIEVHPVALMTKHKGREDMEGPPVFAFTLCYERQDIYNSGFNKVWLLCYDLRHECSSATVGTYSCGFLSCGM
jgi:hypothetical protein